MAVKDLEPNLSTLEKLITAMESGDLSLEENLKHFEQGIALIRESQKTLAEAEQKVQKYLGDGKLEDLT